MKALKTILFNLLKLTFLTGLILFSKNGISQKFEKINTLESQLKEETEHTKLADIYFDLSVLYQTNSKAKSLEKAKRSLTISKGLNDVERQIRAQHQIGDLESKLGNYESALDAHYSALRLGEDAGDQKEVSLGYIFIGNVYVEKGDFELANDFYQKAMELGEKTNCNLCIARVNGALGDLEHLKGNDNLSLQYYLLGLEKVKKTGATSDLALLYYKAGNLYLLSKKEDEALNNYLLSLKFYETEKDEEMQSVLCFEIGSIYQSKGINEDALIYLKNSLSWAEKTGLKAYIKKGYENISEVYENSGDYEHAYEYLKYFDAIKDTREISELESMLELEKKNREIQILNKEKIFRAEQLRTEQILKFIGFVSLFVVVVLVLFLSLALRQKNKINEQLHLASEDANRSRKEKEEFFAYTSHEIRTPLNAVVGMSKLLAETDLSPSQQGYLRTIKTSSQNILFLVNDVLDLSKIESGNIQLENIDFSIRDIVEEVIYSLNFKVREKDVVLKSDIDENIPNVIKGDPVRINQIILNLADNAIKFTSSGEVKITLVKVGETDKTISIHFSVSDTGIGIRKSRIETIFDSFRQESSHTTRQYGGTGLGLAITQKLIELMHGKINVESSYGEGSNFFFDITFKKSKKENLSIPISEDKYFGIRDIKILVVDDNALNREIFFDLINDYKRKVLVDLADDGKIALSKIEETDYDIVLMDIQMPRMDGYEATRLIRKMKGPKSKIPIVAMTAHVLDGVAEKCIEAGMNDYVSKPINLKILTQKIKQYVNAQDETEEEEEKINTDKFLFETTYVHLDTLFTLTNNDITKIDKYIDIFFKNVPADLEAMKDAFEIKDFETVAKMAHKMKGNVGYMGIDAIKDDLLELEKLKKVVGDVDEITDIVGRVEAVIDLAIKELKGIKNNINLNI